ncbi:MAG: hypothetical protein QOG03_450 [Actinomycetota bacterium]|jgi:hypothetical protein|nr:hypothetical protein [Actinomycetota bacterium]
MASSHADVLERLRATVRDLVSLTTTLSAAQMRKAAAPREWSPAQVVAHLADAELVYGFRLRKVVTEPYPHLAAFDENAWADRFALIDEEPKDALARWRVLRESNLRIFDSLVDDEWERTGMHAERGEMSTADIAELLADHDRNHLDQIRKSLAG